MRVDTFIHGRPCVGETRSGDAGLVHVVDDVTWVLLIDALGHGNEAADVADLAIDEAGTFGPGLTVGAGMQRLHRRLVGTRGAAATLMRFDRGRVDVTGVGNVELRNLRGPKVPYLPARGVLGRRLPDPRPLGVELDEPGRLLLFTDGIDRLAPLTVLSSMAAPAMCARLIDDHAKDRDDATVIHVSYVP